MLNKNRLSILLGTAAIVLTLGACSNTQTNDANVKTPSAVQSVSTNIQKLSKGTFSGRSDHVTTGDVTLEKTASGGPPIKSLSRPNISIPETLLSSRINFRRSSLCSKKR